MTHSQKSRYTVRFSTEPVDILAAQSLRHRCFSGDNTVGLDQDLFDDKCQHVLIESRDSGQLACCFRLTLLANGDEIGQTYSAQYYDLCKFQKVPGPMLEVGRFCLLKGASDPDILRLAWGAITRYVDENNVEILFGCSSFQGTLPGKYADAFALLVQRHLGPDQWRPLIKSDNIVEFAGPDETAPIDLRRALRNMPPLLRSYLAMGGWVSDHAVIDPEMDTLHVFTGLEVKAVSPARARLLRAVLA